MNKYIVYLVKLQKLDRAMDKLRMAGVNGSKKTEDLDRELTESEEKVKKSLEYEEQLKKRRRQLEVTVEEGENTADLQL